MKNNLNTHYTHLHDPVKHFWTIFNILICICGQPNQDGENVIELWQNCATWDPDNIVQGFCGIIPHIWVAVSEAGQYGTNQFTYEWCNVLVVQRKGV